MTLCIINDRCLFHFQNHYHKLIDLHLAWETKGAHRAGTMDVTEENQ